MSCEYITFIFHVSRFTLVSPNSLFINDIGKDDRGAYQCIVSTNRGSAQAAGELKLGGNCGLQILSTNSCGRIY